MAEYSTTDVAVRSVSNSLDSIRSRLGQIGTLAGTIKADLAALGTAHSGTVADADALLAASPADPAIITLKAAKDRLVAEFALLTAKADAVTAALV